MWCNYSQKYLIFSFTQLSLALLMELGSVRARKKSRWRRTKASIYTKTTATLLMVILALNIFCSTGFFFSEYKCNVLGSLGQSRLQQIVRGVERHNSRTLSLDVPRVSKQGDGEENFQLRSLSEDEGKRKRDDEVTKPIPPPCVLMPPDERYGEFLLATVTNVVCAMCVHKPLAINSIQQTAQQHFELCVVKRRTC